MYPRRPPRDGIIFVEPEFAGVCPTTNTLLHCLLAGILLVWKTTQHPCDMYVILGTTTATKHIMYSRNILLCNTDVEDLIVFFSDPDNPLAFSHSDRSPGQTALIL